MVRKRKESVFANIELHIFGIFHPEFRFLFVTLNFAFRRFKIALNIELSMRISFKISKES